MSPKVLDQVLSRIPRVRDENVLVGFETSDDAGVYKLTPECALVQTLDFFTPIVDDPETFGAIAAANSLSDVYAMGGRPVTAMSILAYPGKGDLEDLHSILLGGAGKMREAGCVILGGHSVNDDEIKFGYSVTGTVHPDRVFRNSGARAGDVLVYTKLLGTGIISTALKRGIASEAHVSASIESMLLLNRAAGEAMLDLDVHACTDITGFGLLGHAREMAAGSGVTLEIEAGSVELLPGALEYARRGAVPAGLLNNMEFVQSCVLEADALPDDLVKLLYDPQTSGGLLVSLPAKDALLLESRYPGAYRIGRVTPLQAKPIHLL
ncbi:MAG TPA: selenide, water dikinase SelD [Bryobacteraceae bacterium]|nr:selenide, water dikinase SelD [Bryobacteraceae bacterium]